MIRTFRPIPVKKIKLIIFDLDGTLIDSELDLAAAVNAMLRHYGRKELPIEVIGTYIGDGAPMLIRRALGDPAHSEFLQEALNYFLLYYREHKLDNTRIYEGIDEALQQVEPKRWHTAQTWLCLPTSRCGCRATFCPGSGWPTVSCRSTAATVLRPRSPIPLAPTP